MPDMPDWLANASRQVQPNQSQLASDPIMQRLGLSSVPQGRLAYLLGNRNALSSDQLQQALSQGYLQSENPLSDEGRQNYTMGRNAPTIMGMDAGAFHNFIPTRTRYRDPRFVFNDPNYGLVTPSWNEIVDNNAGPLGMLARTVGSMVAGPWFGLATTAANMASERSNGQMMQQQMRNMLPLIARQSQNRMGNNQRGMNPQLLGLLSMLRDRGMQGGRRG